MDVAHIPSVGEGNEFRRPGGKVGSRRMFLRRSEILGLLVSAADSSREGRGDSSRAWSFVRNEGWSPCAQVLLGALGFRDVLEDSPPPTPLSPSSHTNPAEKDKRLGQVAQTRKQQSVLHACAYPR